MSKVNDNDQFSERMKVLVDDHKNPGHLAKLLEVSDRTIRKWMSGTEPARNYLERLSERLNVNAEWLVTGQGPMYRGETVDSAEAYARIPLYDVQARAGEGGMVDSEEVEELVIFSREWIRTELRANPSSLSLIYVGGDSMEPTFRPGDVVLVDHSQAESGTDGIYVLRRDGHLLVKRIQWLSLTSLKLISDNAIYEPILVDVASLSDEFQIVGRVVWGGKQY